VNLGVVLLDIPSARCDSVHVASEKYEQLRALLRSYGSCLVAYSGGVDSAFLAFAAHDVLGDKSLAAIADSPSLPRREFEEALAVARQFRFPVRVVRTREFEDASYLANPDNRCYFCKHELFTELAPLAKAEGLTVIAYGENASDIGDFRPGAQAAAEFQVRAPLKEAGLTKADIRTLSAQLGLPTADKPQMACLSSRVPYGEAVTPQKLSMIEQAENVLRDLGFYDVRVRHHELRSAEFGMRSGVSSALTGDSALRAPRSTLVLHLARIEVGSAEMRKFLENGSSIRVAEALKQIGYAHVTLDLQGYRRGSANELLRSPEPPGATASPSPSLNRKA
jgi:pyridinium-3,5-biscarboxylic acid mononucleotide sulfurtransferase